MQGSMITMLHKVYIAEKGLASGVRK